MPIYVLLFIILTGSVDKTGGSYRFVQAIEFFMLGTGYAWGRSALREGDEKRWVARTGVILNVLLFLLLGLAATKPPKGAAVRVDPGFIESQPGRASDR